MWCATVSGHGDGGHAPMGVQRHRYVGCERGVLAPGSVGVDEAGGPVCAFGRCRTPVTVDPGRVVRLMPDPRCGVRVVLLLVGAHVRPTVVRAGRAGHRWAVTSRWVECGDGGTAPVGGWPLIPGAVAADGGLAV